MGGPGVVTVGAVVGLAVVGVLAALGRPGPAPIDPPALPATTGSTVRAALFCPDLRSIPGTLTTQVVAGTTSPGAGTVTLAAAASAVSAAAPVLAAGQLVAAYAGTITGPVTLRGTGPLTAGLVGEQISRATSTTDQGLAEARCVPARSEQWFVGAATGVGDAPVVVLANPAATRAIVTVTVLTPSGLVAAAAGVNLVVPPHTVDRLPLVRLAPNAAATAVHVQTETGQVSAAIRDVRSRGQLLLGTDWVPVGQPAPTVTVAGLPGSVAGTTPTRTLFVANPGPAPTTVQVTATTSDGSFVPTGLNAVTVPPQSVRAVPVGGLLAQLPATLTIRSQPGTTGRTEPVVAGVLIDVAGTGAGSATHEITYLGASEPLLAAGLVPIAGLGAGAGAGSVLVLSAPQAAATVAVSASAPNGVVVTRLVPVPAGETVAVSLLALQVPAGSSVTLTPTPSSGPLYATRLIEEAAGSGPLLSAYQVTGAPLEKPVPAVGSLPLSQP